MYENNLSKNINFPVFVGVTTNNNSPQLANRLLLDLDKQTHNLLVDKKLKLIKKRLDTFEHD